MFRRSAWILTPGGVRSTAALASILWAATVESTLAQSAAGSEFRVNTYTTANQLNPKVASDASGNFVVVWQDQGVPEYAIGDISGQLFDGSGTPVGTEFRVNSFTPGNQISPNVTSRPDGNFVVVWSSDGEDGSDFGIFGRRFDSAGVAQGPNFQVNANTFGSQFNAGVASDQNGNFIVVWQGPDDNLQGIFGRRFSSAGAPQGTEFRINTYTTLNQAQPAVASDPFGNFLVVWTEEIIGAGTTVFGRRFDDTGTPQGTEFRVNTYTTGYQFTFSLPGGIPARSVAADPNGNFVVVWSSNPQDGSGYGVFGQRFSAAGAPLGTEFQVNSYTTSIQLAKGVATDQDGNFIVTWQSYVEDGSQFGVFGQRFHASGTRLGTEFRVNTYTTGNQFNPDVASDPDGDFVVVWSGPSHEPGAEFEILAQRFGDLIFQDGFESGDLTRRASSAIDGGDLSVGGGAALGGTALRRWPTSQSQRIPRLA